MINENMTALAVNKSLLKEYSSNGVRTVFLDDHTEFQIRLFNPRTTRVSVRIEINGEPLGNELILRPGETIWLERYFDKPDKFRFETYLVESGSEVVERAIHNNGVVTITFYAEKSRPTIYRGPSYTYRETLTTPMPEPLQITWSCSEPTAASNGYECLSATAININSSVPTEEMKETGRVSRGSHSNQEFEIIDMDTEAFPFATETIKILPRSQKPYTKNDLVKVYCTTCGRKIKSKFRYCPFCGTKQ